MNEQEIEDEIVRLCVEAKEKLGWKFQVYRPGCGKNCGCPLEACAAIKRSGDWGDVGRGLYLESPGIFGAGFDLEWSGSVNDKDGCLERNLGRRVARRLKAMENA